MSALRIRDLQLSLTQHRRNLLDGTVRTDEQVKVDLKKEHDEFVHEIRGGNNSNQQKEPDGGEHQASDEDQDDEDEYLVRRHFLVQCRFVTPVRGVSALSVKATDRDSMILIKQKLLEQLHELPEPRRPPDSVIASCGSRYFQRQSIINNFRVSIATDPNQLLFFVDDQDECLPDRATFFELGYESPPLLSVYCATDHLWIRLRGFPERFAIPWHLHMTEVELAKEVFGVLKPEDMRLVRAVFYRDQEHMRRHRTWRRPATEAPPLWAHRTYSGGVPHFGAYETEEDQQQQQQQHRGHDNKTEKRRSAAGGKNNNSSSSGGGGKKLLILEPAVVPLHEWCRMPPPPPTRVNPGMCFEDLRGHVARTRADLVHEALGQANDSWYSLPPDVLRLAEPVHAVNLVPKSMLFTRTRDGRRYTFQVEVVAAKDGADTLDTSQPVGALAEAVLEHCAKTRPQQDQQQQQQQSTPAQGNSPPDSQERNRRRHSPGRECDDDDPEQEEDDESMHNRNLEYQVRLLSWEPHMVNTGNVLDNGEEEMVPHTHPQLFLPFDDDDEQLSPFGRKEIHQLWEPAEMIKKYPFLQSDYFFRQRRADVGVESIADMLRQEARAFYDETLRFSFNRPETRVYNDSQSQLQQKEFSDLVEFDNTSLPRHLSDYGIANGCEVFIEFFSVHTQQWSCDVAHEVHTRMRELADVHLQHEKAMRLKTAAALSGSSSVMEMRRELEALQRAAADDQQQQGDGGGSSSSGSRLEMNQTPLRGRLQPGSAGGGRRGVGSAAQQEHHQQQLTQDQKERGDQLLLGGTDVAIEKKKHKKTSGVARRSSVRSAGRQAGVLTVNFSSTLGGDDDDNDDFSNNHNYDAEEGSDDDAEERSAPTTTTSSLRRKSIDGRFKVLQQGKRRREKEVRAAGFSIINVRTYRGVLLRVPVIFESATVQDVLELVMCATGDVPMFSAVVGPQGDLLSPWTQLRDLERNPGLLHLRVLRRPRPWQDETIETVARAASRKQPHLD